MLSCSTVTEKQWSGYVFWREFQSDVVGAVELDWTPSYSQTRRGAKRSVLDLLEGSESRRHGPE